VQEFVRQTLDSYHCGGKACTLAGFSVHLLEKFLKNVLLHLFNTIALPYLLRLGARHFLNNLTPPILANQRA